MANRREPARVLPLLIKPFGWIKLLKMWRSGELSRARQEVLTMKLDFGSQQELGEALYVELALFWRRQFEERRCSEPYQAVSEDGNRAYLEIRGKRRVLQEITEEPEHADIINRALAALDGRVSIMWGISISDA